MCIYNIYLHMYWGIFFQKGIFMWGLFTKNSFHGETFGGNLHVKGGGSFINAFSNNLNNVNLFSNHVEKFT